MRRNKMKSFNKILWVALVVSLFCFGCGSSGGGGEGSTPGAEETNANLAKLVISQGTLAFSADTTAYNVEVDYSVSSITLTSTPYQDGATLTINGAAATSGTAFGPINLAVGSNTIQIVVTSSDKSTTKTYILVVTRLAEPSHNANLSNLSLSQGTLSPGFNENTVAYNVQVLENVSSITLTPVMAGVNATIKVNDAVVASGAASQAVALTSGANNIIVVVTAEDGTTIKTYTVVVTRLTESSHNANLAKLTISQGSLSPGFSENTTAYKTEVQNSVTTLTLTPAVAGPNANIKVNGVTVKTGAPSKAISLNVGANTITIMVTAEDGTTTKTYTLVATRLAAPIPPIIPITPEPSHNANLANLTLSSGTLAPGFSENTLAYSVEVSNAVSSITVTPTRAGVNATIRVNGSVVASGTASTSIDLNVGVNTISIVVTAEDGSTSKTYSLSVTRLADFSHNAHLASLSLSQGTLIPGFDAGIVNYTSHVDDTIVSTTVTPTAAGVNAAIFVNGDMVVSGAASTVALTPGNNTIKIDVIAEDGFTVTYIIVVTRGGTTISGYAAKGAIRGGTVKVYSLVDGQKATLLGTTTTNSPDGSYSVNIGTYAGPVLIEVSGGTYMDEATGQEIPLTVPLRAALSNASGAVTAVVTPLTELAVRLAEPYDGLTIDKINNANKMISQLLGGINTSVDIITLESPGDTASVSVEGKYGLLLAAISQMASTDSLAGVMKKLTDDLSDNKLHDTGNVLGKALDDYTSTHSSIVAPANAAALNTNLDAITLNGLTPTGDLAQPEILLIALLQDPSQANYDAYIGYMNTFVPPSKEAHLFTAIAQLVSLYSDPDISAILANLPGGSISLDTDFESLSNDPDRIKAIIGAIINVNDVDKVLAAAIARLDMIDAQLALAEGVNASISFTGFDTVYLDDIDVKILRVFTTAFKAVLTYPQAVDITSVNNWNVTIPGDLTPYDIRELFYSDALIYKNLRHSLTNADESHLWTEFLNNNPDLFTYRASASAKLNEFRNLYAEAVSRYGAVMDALNALGAGGRDKRILNAFNISSEFTFQSMMAIKEQSLPSISSAMSNPSAGVTLINNEEVDKRYVPIDGYAYKRISSNIYYGNFAHVNGTFSISDMVNGNNTPRELMLACLDNPDYEMYTAPAGSETDTWWTNWTLYKSKATEIEWDKPVDTYTVPLAAISVTDGSSADWADVPVFFDNGAHIIKLARDNTNNFYLYCQGKNTFAMPTGYWYYSQQYGIFGSYPVINQISPWYYISNNFYQYGDGTTVYPWTGGPSVNNNGTSLIISGEPFMVNGSSLVAGGEIEIAGGYAAIAGRPGSCYTFSWGDSLYVEGSPYYSNRQSKKVKFLPEIN